MELSNIEKLLERYFEATATVAEEEMLREYFAQEDVPLHLKEYAPMFQYFSIAREEKFTRQVSLKPRKKSYIKWISIAAVSILIFGIYFGRSYQEQREAEYAYQETKKALSLLATNLGKGTEKVAYLREFEETKQKIYNKN
jgi:preprotein translocase subunit Sss1